MYSNTNISDGLVFLYHLLVLFSLYHLSNDEVPLENFSLGTGHATKSDEFSKVSKRQLTPTPPLELFPKIHPFWSRPPSLTEPYPTLEVIKSTSVQRYLHL